MKLIKPIPVTNSVLISSSVAENDHPAWAASTVYSVGDLRIRTQTHRIYKCLVAHTSTATPPEQLTGGATPTWQDISPTNRWAMFDDVRGSSTSGTSPLTVELAPGNCSGVALIDIVGESLAVTVTNGAGGPTVYSKTINLDETVIGTVWEYLFSEYQQKEKIALTDLPIDWQNARVIVTITGTSTVKCGICQPGVVYELGTTENDYQVSFEDFSNKETDPEFGYVSIVPRADRMLLVARFETDFFRVAQVNRIMRTMQRQIAAYVPVDAEGYETFITVGYCKEFALSPPNSKFAMCNIEIEELV